MGLVRLCCTELGLFGVANSRCADICDFIALSRDLLLPSSRIRIAPTSISMVFLSAIFVDPGGSSFSCAFFSLILDSSIIYTSTCFEVICTLLCTLFLRTSNVLIACSLFLALRVSADQEYGWFSSLMKSSLLIFATKPVSEMHLQVVLKVVKPAMRSSSPMMFPFSKRKSYRH